MALSSLGQCCVFSLNPWSNFFFCDCESNEWCARCFCHRKVYLSRLNLVIFAFQRDAKPLFEKTLYQIYTHLIHFSCSIFHFLYPGILDWLGNVFILLEYNQPLIESISFGIYDFLSPWYLFFTLLLKACIIHLASWPIAYQFFFLFLLFYYLASFLSETCIFLNFGDGTCFVSLSLPLSISSLVSL